MVEISLSVAVKFPIIVPTVSDGNGNTVYISKSNDGVKSFVSAILIVRNPVSVNPPTSLTVTLHPETGGCPMSVSKSLRNIHSLYLHPFQSM